MWCGLAGFACGRGVQEGEKVAEVWVFFGGVWRGSWEWVKGLEFGLFLGLERGN